MEESRTFFSLSFSVFSSLLAFAACRLSCFAVNYLQKVSTKACEDGHGQPGAQRRGGVQVLRRKSGHDKRRGGLALRLKSAFSRPDMIELSLRRAGFEKFERFEMK